MNFLLKVLTGSVAAFASIGILALSFPKETGTSLLHVSFDATREVLLEIADAFTNDLRAQSQIPPNLIHSHGSSGSQARAVVAGLPADIVSLAIWPDLQTIVTQESNCLVDRKWLNSPSPWFTTMIFIVQKGNPKNIRSWEDLDKPGLKVMIPNPKVSGNGKLAFLSLFGALKTEGKSNEEIIRYLRNIFSRIPVLEGSSRATTLTFTSKGIGDVLITYESEAELILKEKMEFEKIIPEKSIMAPLPIAPVSHPNQTALQRNFNQKYIDFFNSEIAQEIIVKHGFRPNNKRIYEKYLSRFQKPRNFFTVEEITESWQVANRDFFSQDGLFDRIMEP